MKTWSILRIERFARQIGSTAYKEEVSQSSRELGHRVRDWQGPK